MHRNLFVIFALALFTVISGGNLKAAPQQDKAASSVDAQKRKDYVEPPGNALQTNDAKSEEIVLLRAQNKLIQDFQSSLFSTVLWALGIVCTIAIFIAGFGWWSNFKIYDGDKKRLREELEASFAERIAQLELRTATSGSELSRSIETKVEGNLNRAQAEVTALQNRVNDLAKKLESHGEQLAVTKLRDLQIHSELRRVEEKVWETKGVSNNVLITQLQGLEAELEGEMVDSARYTLKRMADNINELFVKTSKPISMPVKKTLLNRLPPDSPVLKAEILNVRELVSNLPVEEAD